MTKTTRRRSDSENNCLSKSFKSILKNNSAIDPSLSLLFASSVDFKPSSGRTPISISLIHLQVQPITPSVKSCENLSLYEGSQSIAELNHKIPPRIEARKEITGHKERKNETGNKDSCKAKYITSENKNCIITEENITSEFNRERKRKRKNIVDVENEHICKLANQDEKGNQQQQKKSKVSCQILDGNQNEPAVLDPDNLDGKEREGAETTQIHTPIHESLNTSSQSIELEKALRTVFLANVSVLAISSKSAKKILLAHMSSFLSDLPVPNDGKSSHKIESIRFRSIAFEGSGLSKKIAFAKKKLMSATTKSTNAYIVYSNAYAAREAVKRLNGTIVLDRHLRVDSVAHPSKTDHRRCVFVGNLGFVDEESSLDENHEKLQKKLKISADFEEGLWRQFGKAGKVESVRVVRDGKTRVGKGFAYVQFTDPNSVEMALIFNEKKYPPLLPRKLRVVRAKALRKTAVARAASHARKTQKISHNCQNSNLVSSSKQLSLDGRAKKLFGHAGAAIVKAGTDLTSNVTRNHHLGPYKNSIHTSNQIAKNTHHKLPESYIFEGHRASSKIDGFKNLKPKSKGRNYPVKPNTRSARRASEWKKTSGKKPSKL